MTPTAVRSHERSITDAPAPERVTRADAIDGRLYFAQVREDPALELRALRPDRGGRFVVVGSGGCTALALIAAGAGSVDAVDLNRSQNHLTELKALAAARLERDDVVRFIGGWRAPRHWRAGTYALLRDRLSPAARAYWDAHRAWVREGVIRSGVSERMIGAIVAVVRAMIHGRRRIERLLECTTLEEQRAFYVAQWDSRRWRALFPLLLNRFVFRKTYEPAFFEHVENPSFPEHFRRLVEHALTRVPVRTNYFLHQMLTGAYPAGDAALPPWLTRRGAARVARSLDRLRIVDGGMTAHLRSLPASSVDGVALSNICEWLAPGGIEELFAEAARVVRPGGAVCFRNFVGWTDVPARFRGALRVMDRTSRLLSARDRSVVQRRFVLCRVPGGPEPA